MASSSGTSSASTSFPREDDDGSVMDQRKRRRMISNRESARRSRMRKQKHLDELVAQVEHLRKENGQLLQSYKIVSQQYIAVEAENSVLVTQMMELTSRLQSLDEILRLIRDGYLCDSSWMNMVSVI